MLTLVVGACQKDTNMFLYGGVQNRTGHITNHAHDDEILIATPVERGPRFPLAEHDRQPLTDRILPGEQALGEGLSDDGHRFGAHPILGLEAPANKHMGAERLQVSFTGPGDMHPYGAAKLRVRDTSRPPHSVEWRPIGDSDRLHARQGFDSLKNGLHEHLYLVVGVALSRKVHSGHEEVLCFEAEVYDVPRSRALHNPSRHHQHSHRDSHLERRGQALYTTRATSTATGFVLGRRH